MAMERVASSCVGLLTQRRGYSVAAAMVRGAGGRMAEEKKKAAAAVKRVVSKKDVATSAAAQEKSAWVPDPVTGYYRPAGGVKEVDAVDLRAKLLTKGMPSN